MKTNSRSNKELLSVAQVASWVVISPERQRRDTESFVDLIMKTGQGVGFRMPRPEFSEYTPHTPLYYVSRLILY